MIIQVNKNFIPPSVVEFQFQSPSQKLVNTIAISFFCSISRIKSSVLNSWSESVREQAKRIHEELLSTAYLNRLDYLKHAR